jgi:hypothetical protein
MGQRFGQLCVGGIGATVFSDDNHIISLLELRLSQAKRLTNPASNTVAHNSFLRHFFADDYTEVIFIILIGDIIKIEVPIAELTTLFKNPLKCFIAF